jgi:integrase
MADTNPIAQHGNRPDSAPPRLLNMRQAAQYLGCSFWTARDYVLQGLILKRMFNLPIQAGSCPSQAALRDATRGRRAGRVLRREQYESTLAHLPEGMRPIVTFAHVTGWRINSEVLPLQWRQVDLGIGEVRLEPGTTKNREGRVFYLTSELLQLLKDQRAAADRLQRKKGMIVQHVFFHRHVTDSGAPGHLAGCPVTQNGFYHA